MHVLLRANADHYRIDSIVVVHLARYSGLRYLKYGRAREALIAPDNARRKASQHCIVHGSVINCKCEKCSAARFHRSVEVVTMTS